LNRRSHIFSALAILVATNYFCFRVELFDGENEENHPSSLLGTVSYSMPTLNWETFDKDNAPQAIVVDVIATIEFLHRTPEQFSTRYLRLVDSDIIRDKSPPFFPVS